MFGVLCWGHVFMFGHDIQISCISNFVLSRGQIEGNQRVQQLDLAEIFTMSMSKLKNDVKSASRIQVLSDWCKSMM